MAGEWIKMRVDLPTDPRARKIARLVGQPMPHVIGALFVLWADADRYTVDGSGLPLTAEDLDADVGIEGFAEALIAVDWLHRDEEGRLSIPRFGEHNGASAKARSQGAKRASKHRIRKDPVRDRAQPSRTTVTEAHLEPEEEPEEEKTGARAPVPAENEIVEDEGGFADWWEAYPRRVGKAAARKPYGKAITAIATARELEPLEARDWLLEVTRRFARSPAGRAGRFCPHPASWLNAGRYDDDPSDWLIRDERQPSGESSRGVSRYCVDNHPSTTAANGRAAG